MTYIQDFLEAAHKHSIFNRKEILQSNQCGCFYCIKTFKSEEIVEWIDEGNSKDKTAQCPFCGIDSVLGDKSGFPITDEIFLNEMHSIYFN